MNKTIVQFIKRVDAIDVDSVIDYLHYRVEQTYGFTRHMFRGFIDHLGQPVNIDAMSEHGCVYVRYSRDHDHVSELQLPLTIIPHQSKGYCKVCVFKHGETL